MLFDHEARLKRIEENMVTKQEMVRVYDTLDKILGFVTKHDQELMFLTRMVQDHDKDIKVMKLKWGMA